MKKGFTLIELLAVVLMISIMTAIAVPQYRSSINRSRAAEAKEMLPAIEDAVDRWMVENAKDDTTGLTFSKLDVSMKGSATGSNSWNTPNFTYTHKIIPQNGASTPTTAVMRTGKFVGTTITYSNFTFACSSSNESACDSLGF